MIRALDGSAIVTLHIADHILSGRVYLLERDDGSLSLWMRHHGGALERIDYDLAGPCMPAERLYMRTDGLWMRTLRELEREGVLLAVGVLTADRQVYASCVPMLEVTKKRSNS